MRPIARTLLAVGALLFIVFLAAACAPAPAAAPTSVTPSPTPLPLPGPLMSTGSSSMPAMESSMEVGGADLYLLSCAACHGEDKAGKTLEDAGQTIEVPALAWNDLSSMYSSKPDRGSVPDQLALAITKGQNEDGEDMSTVMPRWSSLSKAQVQGLIDYLQSGGQAEMLTEAAAGLKGQQLYETACAACHGADRAGSTLEKDGQKISVPSLGWDDLSNMYSTNPGRGAVQEQLALAMTKGQNEDGQDMSPIMPRWAILAASQVDSLIEYLQSSGGMAGGSMPTAMPSGMSSGGMSMGSAGSQLSGGALFQLSCAACHGQDRAGNKFTVDGQTIEVPALTWDDLNGMYATDPSRGSVQDQLALAIRKGEDETGGNMNAMMPRWAGLTDAQIQSLVQYIQTADTAGGASSAMIPADLKGEQLYEAACAACHGPDGAGKTFESDSNKITTPTLHWPDLNKMYSANPARGAVEDQIGLAITKGQNEDGDEMAPMMPHWSFLSQAQVQSLIQYLETAFK